MKLLRLLSSLMASGGAVITVVTQTGVIPLGWNDPLFSGLVDTHSRITIPNDGSISDKSITEASGEPTVTFLGAGTMDRVRIRSREGVRIAGSGAVTILNSYIETTGSASDHADGIQAYAPGSHGTLTLRNSMVVSHYTAATAGMFIADNWTGSVVMEGVVFKGGPYGFRIYPDIGGDTRVSLKNVFFVGPFRYGRYAMTGHGGHKIIINQWENIYDADIVNGVLVPGAVVPHP